MACHYEKDALLYAPLVDLCHACISQSIEQARQEGKRLAIRDLRLLRGERSREFFAEPIEYWTGVILPLRDEGAIPDEEYALWEQEFDRGALSRDPRVQAYCAAWAATAAELASAFERRRSAVCTFVEAQSSDEVQFADHGRTMLPIFSHKGMRYCVAFAPEIPAFVATVVRFNLSTMPVDLLFGHTCLPEGAEYLLEELQEFEDEADDALYALVEDQFEELCGEFQERVGLASILAGYDGEDAEIVDLGPVTFIRWPEEKPKVKKKRPGRRTKPAT